MHLEIFVEEPSAEAALAHLIPRILGPEVTFKLLAHQGKPDLLRKLPARLRAYRTWLPDDWRIVVLLDTDGKDCVEEKRRLEEIARDAGLVTKSNLILGMGEHRDEVEQTLRDLHEAGTDLVTITQYLRPSPRHHPVERWVRPEEFVELEQQARDIGFAGVMSGPLVRSSYRAGRLYEQARQRRVAS